MTAQAQQSEAQADAVNRIQTALQQADRTRDMALMYGGGSSLGLEAYAAALTIRAQHARIAELEASQAQRAPLSEHKQALDFLAGLHPGITIDGPPMAVAELIFDAVQAEQRALKEEIEKKERNLDWMRKELAKRPSGITQEKQG